MGLATPSVPPKSSLFGSKYPPFLLPKLSNGDCPGKEYNRNFGDVSCSFAPSSRAAFDRPLPSETPPQSSRSNKRGLRGGQPSPPPSPQPRKGLSGASAASAEGAGRLRWAGGEVGAVGLPPGTGGGDCWRTGEAELQGEGANHANRAGEKAGCKKNLQCSLFTRPGLHVHNTAKRKTHMKRKVV